MKLQRIRNDRKYINNSKIAAKVKLRLHSLQHIKKKEINILELYGGEGFLWDIVQDNTDKKLNRILIDVKKYKKNFRADNQKLVPNLDLSQFDIIDADCYGLPFNILEIIFDNKTLRKNTIIHYTAIIVRHGYSENSLKYLGLTKNIVKRCISLFSGEKQFLALRQLLLHNNINELYYIRALKSNKEYGYFIT